MKDKYLVGLIFFLFVLGIGLFFQLFFVFKMPNREKGDKVAIFLLENKRLCERVNMLLLEKGSLSAQIKELIRENEETKEAINALLSKPRVVEKKVFVDDPLIKERLWALGEERRRILKEKDELDREIARFSDELKIKEEQINTLNEQIKKDRERFVSGIKETEGIGVDVVSLENGKISLQKEILRLQEDLAQALEKKKEGEEKNSLLLKEIDDLKQKELFALKERKEQEENLQKKLEEKEQVVQDVFRKKEEEKASYLAKLDEEKKQSQKRSITGNLLSILLLWKK